MRQCAISRRGHSCLFYSKTHHRKSKTLADCAELLSSRLNMEALPTILISGLTRGAESRAVEKEQKVTLKKSGWRGYRTVQEE